MRKKSRRKLIGVMVVILVVLCMVGGWLIWQKTITKEKPEDLIVEYMNHIEKKEYDAMFSMVAKGDEMALTKEEFIERNSKIYEGIEVKDLKIENIKAGEEKNKQVSVIYDTFFETVAGSVNFPNEATFVSTEEGYRLLWKDSLIIPEMEKTDKIKVSTQPAERGTITDRNGNMLAGKGVASSVGIVPGKLENREEALPQIAALLNLDAESIGKKLDAGWVKEDSFVPIATVTRVTALDLTKLIPDEEMLNEQSRQEQLLAIPGVMLTDTEVRSYPLGEAASHLIGYVQGVTAEDLEKHKGEDYRSDSVIGRGGMEGLYEKELKGQDGHEINLVDAEGNLKKVIAVREKKDGEEIRLTIDSNLQRLLYEQYKEDPGCSVAVHPYTGEVLALVSTPSYDNNAFIMGMPSEKWNALNDDPSQPLYNRFRQKWSPGSTFKPVTGAIGIKTGTVDPNEDFGNVGLSWQKDSSWGDYHVTTLHAYEPVVMKNALIYSDNIYFAKAALKIGADNLAKSLDELGFNKELPFEIAMAKSQYSNSDKIESEVQLADSGYGQGQVLVNPLHLASIYTAFLNDGNMIKPYLRYKETPAGEVWIEQAFSPDIVAQIREGLDGVVNDPHGTGYAAHRDDIALAGKTGTAELKASKEDTTGTEIGWFAVYTEDKAAEKPILLISMVENVKGSGGSGYVVRKDKAVLDQYLQ